jgi:fumarate hydratase class II
MSAVSELNVTAVRQGTDSLGAVEVPADKLWGAQTQRSLKVDAVRAARPAKTA